MRRADCSRRCFRRTVHPSISVFAATVILRKLCRSRLRLDMPHGPSIASRVWNFPQSAW